MIILISIVLLVLFLKIVGMIFGAGLLAVSFIGVFYYALPVLLIVGVLLIALKPF